MQARQLQAMRSLCITAYVFVLAPMRQWKWNSHLTMLLEEVSSIVQVLDGFGTSACVYYGCNRRCGRNFCQLGLSVQNTTQVIWEPKAETEIACFIWCFFAKFMTWVLHSTLALMWMKGWNKKQWHAKVSNFSHLQGWIVMMQKHWWGSCW